MEKELMEKMKKEKERKLLLLKLDNLEYQASSTYQLLLDKRLAVKYEKDYLEKDMKLADELKRQITEKKNMIEKLNRELPILEERLVETLQRIELRKEMLRKAEKEQDEWEKKTENLNKEIMNLKVKLKSLEA